MGKERRNTVFISQLVMLYPLISDIYLLSIIVLYPYY